MVDFMRMLNNKSILRYYIGNDDNYDGDSNDGDNDDDDDSQG